MESHKYIRLLGEVIFRGSPVRIPTKFYESAFFTLQITTPKLRNDGTYEFIEDCFNIHTFKTEEIYKIRQGYIVSCLIKREGKLWVKDDDMVYRYDMRSVRGLDTKANFGKYPVIFESIELMGTINIVDDTFNKEVTNKYNRDFEYFLDDISPS